MTNFQDLLAVSKIFSSSNQDFNKSQVDHANNHALLNLMLKKPGLLTGKKVSFSVMIKIENRLLALN